MGALKIPVQTAEEMGEDSSWIKKYLMNILVYETGMSHRKYFGSPNAP